MKKRIISFLLALCLVTALLPLNAGAATSYNASAAISYAKSHWNDGVGLCAEFVSNCLKAGGLSSWSTECTALYNKLNKEVVSGSKIASVQQLKTSGNNIKMSDNKDKVSRGDVVFWRCAGCPNDTVGGDYQHVALVSDVSSTYLKVYAHNYAMNNETTIVGNCYDCGRRYSNVVVIHFGSASSGTSNTTKIEYFDCNVQINTTVGKAVNLYTNIGDSQRRDYFDRGQTAYSTKGAKVSDGSTWYQIQAYDQNNKIITVWLKAGTSGVTIKDLNSSSGTANSVSISANPSTLNLDLSSSSSGTVRLSISGSYGALGGSRSSASGGIKPEWVDWGSGWAIAKFTGTEVGSTDFTFEVYDSTKTNIIAITTIHINVTAPSYTVSYNANGGSGAPGSQAKTYQKALTLSSIKPTRTGYKFSGWATSASASTAKYQPGASYTQDSNITLYAVWVKDDPCANGHTWNSGVVTTEPTYSSTGVRTYICTVCGETRTETIPKLADPCASGHTWDNGIVTTEPTTSSTGVRTYTCTVCGETRTETIPKLADPCASGHTWNNGMVTREPTTTSTGIRAYTCTVCGETKTEEIPALGTGNGLTNFVPVNFYSNNTFRDVASNAWYVDNVSMAYQLGLMKGTGESVFSPGNNMTLAEAVTLAARLHSIYYTGGENFTTYDGGNWYDPYVNYARNNGILSENYNYTQPATREQFVHILAQALPAEALEPIKGSISFADSGSIVYAADIQLLSSAGVIAGIGSGGALYFQPHNTITRAEVAAVVTRMAQPGLRVS